MGERSDVPAELTATYSPARVLVAGGNANNRGAAVCMLKDIGLRADVAADGREAVERLRLRPYDLVLLDCRMPLMDGIEAAGEIRKHEPPHRRTPIVAMTAETGADCLDRCLSNGIDDVLRKPIRFAELTAAIRRWLPAKRESTRTWIAPPAIELQTAGLAYHEKDTASLHED
jgi:CheY-like chemotaxis protein